MINEILNAGSPVTPESELWLRTKMRKITRYVNLEPRITHFTVGVYGRNRMVLAHHVEGRAIPLPKRELSHSLSKKTRVLTNLRKVIEYQVLPHRVKGMHVDHVYPFEAIVTDWLTLAGLSWDKVTAKHYHSFDEYHYQVAQYQLLSPAENIRKSNTLNPLTKTEDT